MRLPVTPQLSTKDGISNKNARLTNVLQEVRQVGEVAQVRPGLVEVATTTGAGNGLVCYSGELVSVFGANLGIAVSPGGVGDPYSYPISGEGAVIAALPDSRIFLCTDDSNLEEMYPQVMDLSTGDITYLTGWNGEVHSTVDCAQSTTAAVFTTIDVGLGQDYAGMAYRVNFADLTAITLVATSVTRQFHASLYGGGYFVFLATDGTASYAYKSSNDGLTFSSVTITTLKEVQQGVFDGTTWWFYSADGTTVYTTTDLVNFTSSPVTGSPSGYFTYFNGVWYAGAKSSNDGYAFSEFITTYGVRPYIEPFSQELYFQVVVSSVVGAAPVEIRLSDGVTVLVELPAAWVVGNPASTPITSEGGYLGMVGTGAVFGALIAGEPGIPPLTTLSSGIYDFTQSPL